MIRNESDSASEASSGGILDGRVFRATQIVGSDLDCVRFSNVKTIRSSLRVVVM